jgi:hypothetical protein
MQATRNIAALVSGARTGWGSGAGSSALGRLIGIVSIFYVKYTL